MGLELKCADIEKEMGIEASCPYVAHGENEKELLADMKKHAKEVHGYTDEDLKDPNTIAIMKKHISNA
jgi:predicted small metal-binding protein